MSTEAVAKVEQSLRNAGRGYHHMVQACCGDIEFQSLRENYGQEKDPETFEANHSLQRRTRSPSRTILENTARSSSNVLICATNHSHPYMLGKYSVVVWLWRPLRSGRSSQGISWWKVSPRGKFYDMSSIGPAHPHTAKFLMNPSRLGLERSIISAKDSLG